MPRPNRFGPNTGGPATARLLPKNEMKKTKTAAKPAAKIPEKAQDPAARALTLFNMGWNLEYQQNYDAALEYYREIVAKYPTLPPAKKAAARIKWLTEK
jgi:TolA-binding protein